MQAFKSANRVVDALGSTKHSKLFVTSSESGTAVCCYVKHVNAAHRLLLRSPTYCTVLLSSTIVNTMTTPCKFYETGDAENCGYSKSTEDINLCTQKKRIPREILADLHWLRQARTILVERRSQNQRMFPLEGSVWKQGSQMTISTVSQTNNAG